MFRLEIVGGRSAVEMEKKKNSGGDGDGDRSSRKPGDKRVQVVVDGDKQRMGHAVRG